MIRWTPELWYQQRGLNPSSPQLPAGRLTDIRDVGDPDFDVDVVREPGVACEADVDFKPTEAHPGTEEKIEVMSQRFHLGLPLHHPEDEKSHAYKVHEGGLHGAFVKRRPDGTTEGSVEDEEEEFEDDE